MLTAIPEMIATVLIVDAPSWSMWIIYTLIIVFGALVIAFMIRKRMRDAAYDQRVLREKVR
ncbi:MAG TPA: hypothetical protein PK511_14665, partial [Chitinophagales bacterium]|nr:hypothetical protein [Chitinophagales bacterium]HNI55767.1 hypothetical protein [Chitinophagales bacterium]HNM07549.1 hypothetical protein [Chitinophagales bacterium]HNO28313.1 hypothetical protein [Chitinophagales bacterium]